MQLLIDEHLLMDGTPVRTYLGFDGTRVTVTCDDGVRGALSPGAIAKVMERYGKPLDPQVAPLGNAARLAIGDAGTLRMLKFRATVDVEGKDWLVWERAGAEPLAALATGVAAALRYLSLQLAEK